MSYDQWFLTNISPSWKIKSVKECLIAKALNVPFDRRLLHQESPTDRPPSPITFAPIRDGFPRTDDSSPRVSSDSEVLDDYRSQRRGGLLRNRLSLTDSLSDSNCASQPEWLPEKFVPRLFTEAKAQIYTDGFTLIRFSTGQILEDHCIVSWYDLGPHELLELHCSSPPTTFARALVFGHMLTNGGSITINIPAQSIPALASPTVSFGPTTATLSLATVNPPRLASLPRNDLTAYLEPYWEGWVRVLYVAWRPEAESPPKKYVTEAASFMFPGEEYQYLSQPRKRNDKMVKVQEWREKWAVIRNGVLRLCKSRNVGLQVETVSFCSHSFRQDPASSRLPLSALVSLSGAEYFSNNDPVPVNQPTSSSSETYMRASSPQLSLAATVRPYRSSSVSGPSRKMPTPADFESFATGRYVLTSTASNSPTAPRVLSPLMPTTPVASIGSPFSATSVDLTNTDPERSRRERAAIRELEQERIQKAMAKRARLEKQSEHMMRWDDFGVVFGGKSKAKGKEKEKDWGRRGGKYDDQSTLRGFEGGPEKDKGFKRERQFEKDRKRAKVQNHNRERVFHPDDHHIPISREDALAKGMLIVCAKFGIDPMEDTEGFSSADKGSALHSLKHIGSDAPPSAINEGQEFRRKDDLTGEDRRWPERNAAWQQSQASPAFTPLSPPRKGSLPGLGLSMLGSGGNITPGGSKFGGFSGSKDRDAAEMQNLDKQDGSDLSIEPHEMKKLNLSINTSTLDKGAGSALSSPYYMNDHRWDERDEEHITERRVNTDEKRRRRRRRNCKVETVVLDLGTETGKFSKSILSRILLTRSKAYNSFLRILHRQFPPPIQSSFLHRLESLVHSNTAAPHQNVSGAPPALPYPEWRRDLVFHARLHGMRELDRPLPLALHDWETYGIKPAQERRKHKPRSKTRVKGYSGLRNQRKDDVSQTRHGSDNDAMDIFNLDSDDSGDESADESARWWQDIPRQLLSEGKQVARWAASGQGNYEDQEYSPSSPNMPFTDPFDFSLSGPDSSDPSSSGLTMGMKARLRPSVSSSTIASHDTSSSVGTRYASDFHSYSRRIISPSQTLSSPSSNESFGSYLYPPFPQGRFSPDNDFHHPNAARHSGSPSVLHHSVSMPNTTILRGPIRERTVTGPAFFSKPILTAAQIHQIEAEVDVQKPTSKDDDFSGDDDVLTNRPILSQAQIQQIETETEAWMSGTHTPVAYDSPDMDAIHGAMNRHVSIPEFDGSIFTSNTRWQAEQNDELEPDSGGLGPDASSVFLDTEDFGSVARRSMNTTDMYGGSTSSSTYFRHQDMANYSHGFERLGSSILDPGSVSAKAILRKVRSGPSLQTAMEVHFEQYEEDEDIYVNE